MMLILGAHVLLYLHNTEGITEEVKNRRNLITKQLGQLI